MSGRKRRLWAGVFLASSTESLMRLRSQSIETRVFLETTVLGVQFGARIFLGRKEMPN